MDLTPICHHYDLTCDPERAFEVFALRMGSWWPPMYTANAETFANVEIDQRVGGTVVEVHSTGERHEWGKVIDLERPSRVRHSSNLAIGEGDPSIVTASFAPAPSGGTSFDFEHGGWNESNAAVRGKFNEWPAILGRFVVLANGSG